MLHPLCRGCGGLHSIATCRQEAQGDVCVCMADRTSSSLCTGIDISSSSSSSSREGAGRAEDSLQLLRTLAQCVWLVCAAQLTASLPLGKPP